MFSYVRRSHRCMFKNSLLLLHFATMYRHVFASRAVRSMPLPALSLGIDRLSFENNTRIYTNNTSSSCSSSIPGIQYVVVFHVFARDGDFCRTQHSQHTICTWRSLKNVPTDTTHAVKSITCCTISYIQSTCGGRVVFSRRNLLVKTVYTR